MSTIATCAIDPYRVLAAMGGGAVQAHLASLVAVGCVDRPFGLVPPAFEIVGDLGKGRREKSESEKSYLAEHGCGWNATDSNK